jgi:imidazolonepropionase
MRFSIEEAITAMTLNGAAAIGRAERIGSIEVGKEGDLVMLNAETPAILPYYTGMNAVQHTIKRGKIIINQ